MRIPLLFVVLLLVAAGSGRGSEPVAAVPADVRRFMETHCRSCHGPTKQEGDFRVDALGVSATAADAERWRLVLDNLQLGEMPPEGASRPPQDQIDRVTGWIHDELERAAAALAGAAGEVVLRRLNRLEYENTIADLFDVRGEFTAGFPEDVRAHGFDNNGAALMLSATQLQEYMKAADTILARGIAPAQRPETVSKTSTLHDDNRRAIDAARKGLANRLATFDTLTPAEQRHTRAIEAAARENPESHGYLFPVLDRGVLRAPRASDGPEFDAVITVRQYFSGEPHTGRFFNVRTPGWYRVKAVAYALANDGRPVRLKFSGGAAKSDTERAWETVFTLTTDQPREVEATYYLEPNDRVTLTMLDGAPHSQGRTMIDQPGPFLAVRSFAIEGPLYESWPPRGHRTIFGDTDPAEPTAEKAAAIAAHLGRRLFRRPVDADTVRHYRGLYESLAESLPPAEALRGMLAAMLVSPRFLYLQEPPGGPDGHAIAARMATFLWRSTPDDELLEAAADGSLLDPAGRRAQAERMLRDPRHERFVRDFTGQWLRVREVGLMKPSRDLYPEYTPDLEAAMRGETEHFMAELFREDLPLSNLIDSDWTMLNEPLARHYGIDGVAGPDFRRVSLDKSKTVRGGLLTHASIHAITSNGTVTSPVMRGAWVLERFLGTPAPPPPPDVPAIEPDIRGATTIKEQLANHRTVAGCASCHKRIDPLGFALENFDVIGGWRDNYRTLAEPKPGGRAVLSKQGPAVESADVWGGEGSFAGFEEFRTLLGKRENLVVQNVANQLATFALGRAPGFADREPLAAIATATRERKSGLKSLLLDLVASPVFARP